MTEQPEVEANLKSLSVREGALEMELQGGACRVLVEAFIAQFKDQSAKSYLEMGFYHPDTGPMTVTLQRAAGLTPAGKVNEMKRLIREGKISEALDL